MVRTSTPLRSVLDSYDFIIVGGGSAGCVVASRLSEDPSVRVLLLEAGGVNDTTNVNVPAACGKLQHSEHNWEYYAKEQGDRACTKLKEGRSFWPRGKGLGGSSAINYMAYVRGAPADYDCWAEEHGATGWSYKEVLPYFVKSEDHRGPGDPACHGRTGPLTTCTRTPVNPVARAFVDSAKASGHVECDYNGKGAGFGASLLQQTVRNGKRCSTALAFVDSASSRANFHVLVNALVRRIVLEGRQAVGVEVESEGSQRKIEARREIVLSAGAINSPQLLMLSGIGPRRHLEDVGIACLHELNGVGDHMQDHLFVPMRYKSAKPPGVDIGVVNSKKAEGLPYALHALYRYFVHGDGILTSSSYDATLFFKTGLDPERRWPDAQIGAFCNPMDADVMENNLRIPREAIGLAAADFKPDAQAVGLVPVLLHPKSKGSVRLASADPHAAPIIDANYLSDAAGSDLITMREILKSTEALVRKGPLAEILRPSADHAEEMNKFEPGSNAYYEELVRRLGTTLYHPVGTCSIGKVVDPELRVIGLKGLRVVDASIMPEIPSGNTNAPTIMVGEKGAQLIADAHCLKPMITSKL
eukprot:TRINITY_DN1667_c0_g3_i1.p1 TRINITY_DN1667_c0_g3~~TRINITY_DN1667_c0_g3_i1.p1  ORF type:complete len:586 (-),score=56.95 TRINITY_DN1667_c0_g3_i1:163-1920(-)